MFWVGTYLILIKTEIERLVKSNILVPVDHREKAISIFPILKPDGMVKICEFILK